MCGDGVITRVGKLFIYLVDRSRLTVVGFSAFSLSRRLRSLECAIGQAPRWKGAELVVLE